MYTGILYALAACFIWGLIFIIPQFMEGFSPVEISLGRYFFYGIFSLAILIKERLQNACSYPVKIWLKALYFSLFSSFGYYIFVVLALRYSTPAICALILGISPISIAFYGNWKQKECSYRSLVLPSTLILIGLIIINTPNIVASAAPSTYALGLLCGFCALSSWSWFVVANSRFLKDNPQISSNDWSTLVGVATFFWACLFSCLYIAVFNEHIEDNKFSLLNPSLAYYLGGCATLGFVCSWLGSFLWNKASVKLPVSLAGQLTIFETIFGIIFVYALEGKMPPQFELLGIIFLLAAIIYGIRVSAQAEPQPAI